MKKCSILLLLMVLFAGAALAQRTVTGTVSDGTGAGLPFANVFVKGTDPAVIASTDEGGKYSIDVPNGYTTLVFSMVGFTTQEITLGASNVVDVTLSEGVELSGVVVTALGISREERALGYAVTQVGGDLIKGSGEVNAIQGLAAKTPGIQVVGTGGTPGASTKLLIRGNKTFTGNNQPLVVVDGIPYDNQTQSSVAGDYPFNPNLGGVNNSNRAIDLNPDDIESVNVLKGPAAAALYGTRAANGVLIITTKKAKGGKGINVNFSSTVSFDMVNKLPELQNTYAQGNGGGTILPDGTVRPGGNFVTNGYNGSAGTANSWGPFIGTDTSGLGLYNQSYDNLGNYFGTGVTYDNNVSISGGNEMTNFRVSYGNTNQTGMLPNTKLVRNSLRFNAQTGNDKFLLQGTAAFVNTRGRRGQNGSNLSGVMLSLTRMPASFNALGGDGANGWDNPDGSSYTYFAPYDNPYWSANHNPMNDNTSRITSGVTLRYMPFDWLDVTYRIGVDAYSDFRKQIFDIGANDTPEPTGEVWENVKRRLEVNSDFFLTFKRDFSETFNGSLTLGANVNHRFDQDVFTRGRTLTIPGFYNLSNASNLYASEANATKRLAGVFFDLNLGWRSMLYLNVAGRNDWASTFGANTRKNGFFYPSTSLSFVFTELLPENDILSFGKLRFSWAMAGIEPSPYSTQTYFTQPFFTDGFTDGISFPFLGQNGFAYSSTLGNPDLKPEIVTSIETGLEARFFGGRLTLDFTYYNQKSTNLIVQRPIAASTGFQSFLSNAGSMVNRGIEIQLGGDIVSTDKFNWNLSANFTRNYNEVLSLPEGVDEIDIEAAFASIGSYAIVGQPYGALYGTRWDRTADGQLIIGANGIPVVAATRGNIGNPFPDWTMGINNSLSFGGLSLSFLFDIRQGGDIWNGTYARLSRIGRTLESANRENTYVVQGVVEQPDGSYAPNTTEISPLSYFSHVVGDGGLSATENAVQDGSWVRLREMTLSYTLPANNIPVLKNATLFVTGRNLWLSTNYTGVDPETSLTGAGSNVSGFDYFNMPSTRSFIVGLRAGF